MKPYSTLLADLPVSQSVAITVKAQSMKAAGKDIVSLSAGEPDFDTPEHIRNAAIDAIHNGCTRYGPANGDPALIQAITAKFQKDNNIAYGPKNIVVSAGAKQCIFNALMATCNAGDEVIIPAPYWVTYPALAKLAGALAVIVPGKPEQGFKVNAADMEQAVTKKTKAIILNSPANPAGTVYSKQEIEEIGALAVQHQVFVIADEVYERIIFDNRKHISPASLSRQVQDLCITVNGVSKAYAMTGWRIGYLGAPEHLAGFMTKFQGHTTHHPSTISMKAALAALTGPSACVKDMVAEFSRRRNLVTEMLQKIDGIQYHAPEGSFYAFPNVSRFYRKTFRGRAVSGSQDLCDYLLEEMNLALVPGIAFGEDRCVRLSFAASMETIEKGLERFKKGLEKLG